MLTNAIASCCYLSLALPTLHQYFSSVPCSLFPVPFAMAYIQQ
ncbi:MULTISPECIES: hypothetical protein [unclassified Moorena]|nr:MULTISPECIES: hypothetical protein [unclassified Moorena]